MFRSTKYTAVTAAKVRSGMEAYSAIMSVAHEIKHAKQAVALTGAGISAESGVDTFRGRDGLWSRYDPALVASIGSFSRDPQEFWQFAREIGPAFLNAKPNPAHEALAELERIKRLDCVITQNVDGLHQRAGSRRVIEIHGNAGRVSCILCGTTHTTLDILDRLTQQDVPTCTKCGGALKPDVVLFGEEIPRQALKEALKKIGCTDLLLAIGTSLEVQPAASFPETAKKNRAKLVLINSEGTDLDELADYRIRGPAGEILPKIVQAMKVSL